MILMLTRSGFKLINVFSPYIGLRDIYFVSKSLIKSYISGTSPVIKEFENKFSNFIGKDYAIAVSNGSVALDLSLQALDLRENDEVILPSFTIISALSAVLRTPAKPVFCDVDEFTWNTDLKHIKDLISDNTKAIILVHTYGLVSDVVGIKDYCAERNITIIEDTAEAHGQSIENKMCGSFGQISTFSFYANKHITTGEGGMILVDSKELYKKLLNMRNLDFNNKKRFVHENLYWNYRLSGLQAALGLSQIKTINSTIRRKIIQAKNYYNLLEEHQDKFQLPIKKINGVYNHYWVFGIVLKREGIRDNLINYLDENGIETRPFFYPLHKQPLLGGKYENLEYKNSERIGTNGLYLPMGKRLTKSQQKDISSKLIEGYKLLSDLDEN